MINRVETMNVLKTDNTPPPDHVLEAALDAWGQAGGRHLVPITGRSMLPLLREDDRVLVAHGWAGLKRGDVVVFRQPDRSLAAHRVLRIHHSGQAGPIFFTKGDNTPNFDPPLNASQIVGRVLSVKRGGRSMPLDTLPWRIGGWFIVASTLAWARLYGGSRNLKQKVLGPQPNRLTAFLRGRVLAFSSLARKVIQIIVCRWQDDSIRGD